MNDEPKFAQVDTWAVTTPGAFIGYVADEQDAAIAFVVGDKKQFDDDTFMQLMLVIQIPNGHVRETIGHMSSLTEKEDDEILISTTLTKLMEAGLVK